METLMRLLLPRHAACLLLIALTACAPDNAPRSLAVAQAYESSGVITVPPYTRTIFSGTNF
jgi:hypothetical protein